MQAERDGLGRELGLTQHVIQNFKSSQNVNRKADKQYRDRREITDRPKQIGHAKQQWSEQYHRQKDQNTPGILCHLTPPDLGVSTNRENALPTLILKGYLPKG
jgi:hypothetical protein